MCKMLSLQEIPLPAKEHVCAFARSLMPSQEPFSSVLFILGCFFSPFLLLQSLAHYFQASVSDTLAQGNLAQFSCFASMKLFIRGSSPGAQDCFLHILLSHQQHLRPAFIAGSRWTLCKIRTQAQTEIPWETNWSCQNS